MANELTRSGYGQIELNHVAAQRTGQIYAQLPAAAGITVLENGQFVKYDLEAGAVNYSGDGEWMLVANEVKLYQITDTTKDFAQKLADGAVVPRVFKTNVGDIYTTNCVDVTADLTASPVGQLLTPNASGYLKIAAGTEEMLWNIVKVTTMPDGQKAVKIQRIK